MPGARSSRVDLALIAALVVAWLLLAPGEARAGERPCTEKIARAVTIDDLADDLSAYEGRCVSVTGIWDGILFADQDAFYQDTRAYRRRDENSRRKQPSRRIGFRPYEDGVAIGRLPMAQWGSATGIIHDCGLDWGMRKEIDGELIISMGSGYCHYNNGAVMRPVVIQGGDPILMKRKVGIAAARVLGDVVLLEDNWKERSEVLAVIDRYMATLRTGDRRAFADLHDWVFVDIEKHDNGVLDGDVSATLAAVFDARGSALARLRAGELEGPILYRQRWGGDTEAYACFFPPHYDRKKWPISTIDMSNTDGRPYACFMIYSERRSEGGSVGPFKTVWLADTPISRMGFAEP